MKTTPFDTMRFLLLIPFLLPLALLYGVLRTLAQRLFSSSAKDTTKCRCGGDMRFISKTNLTGEYACVFDGSALVGRFRHSRRRVHAFDHSCNA